jgi:microcystin-dependent protein
MGGNSMFKINPTAGAAVSANLFAGVVLLASPGVAAADDINPFDNTQPSLVITEAVQLEGTFPDPGAGTPSGNTLGFIYGFAGNFAPKGSVTAGGQLLPINQNPALFSILGTTYGGAGITNFALPNLQGQAIIGSSSPSVPLGVATGSQVVTLSPAQIPPGGNQPFNNVQPSLPLTPLIFTGNTPPLGGSTLFPGQIANFAGNFVPGGWAAANGALLPIAQNQALFNVIGTTYGGDGVTNFALPNLQGTVAVGADSAHPVGTTFGQQSTVVNTAQLPPGGAPVNNDQPSLSLTYLIAVQGVFPSNGGGGGFSDEPLIGQIVEFAGTGDVAPPGWDVANGQLLNITDDQALFQVIGTTYGGDGITTFALPDFDGRTAIGSGMFDEPVGLPLGSDEVTLTGDITSTATPLPTTLPLFAGGLGFVGYLTRRKSAKQALAA